MNARNGTSRTTYWGAGGYKRQNRTTAKQYFTSLRSQFSLPTRNSLTDRRNDPTSAAR